MKKIKFYIKGMSCVSCEVILENKFKEFSEVIYCKVNHKNGDAEVIYNKDISIAKLKNVVQDCGYIMIEQENYYEKRRKELISKLFSNIFNFHCFGGTFFCIE